MKRFLTPNIGGKGRIIRGAISVALFIGATFAFRVSAPLGVMLIIAGVFTLFEAMRGWCVMRACGVKTRY